MPSAALGLKDGAFKCSLSPDGNTSPGTGIKDYIVGLARSRLPLVIGDKFAGVVVTCLTCLDLDNQDFSRDDSEIL